MPEAPVEVAATPPSLPSLKGGWRARRRARRAGLDASVVVGRGVVVDGDVTVGAGCVLADGVRLLAAGGPIVIGAGTVIGEKAAIVAHAGVEIGRHCLLGDGVRVEDFAPVTDDVEVAIWAQGLRTRSVRIGDGARLGHGCAVGPGVRIGAGAMVGAHVVVERDVPAGTVHVPAPPPKPRRTRR